MKSIAMQSTLLFIMSAIGVTCIERFAKLGSLRQKTVAVCIQHPTGIALGS
jgi:hypothetical protein